MGSEKSPPYGDCKRDLKFGPEAIHQAAVSRSNATLAIFFEEAMGRSAPILSLKLHTQVLAQFLASAKAPSHGK